MKRFKRKNSRQNWGLNQWWMILYLKMHWFTPIGFASRGAGEDPLRENWILNLGVNSNIFVRIMRTSIHQIPNTGNMRFILALLMLLTIGACNDDLGNGNKLPVVETADVMEISNTTALVGGQIMDEGGSEIIERGILFGAEPNLEETGSRFQIGQGGGRFTARLRNLEPGTEYQIMAYAINEQGMGTGQLLSFETTLIHVSTSPVKGITASSAIVGGEVADTGQTDIEEYGVFWGEHPNADQTGEKVPLGAGEGHFSTRISNLEPYSSYYVVAYAISQNGTTLGEEISFTTVGTGAIYLNMHGHQLKIPYHRNYSLGVENEDIVRAIIAVHGLTRIGDQYHETVASIADDIPGAHESTIIIAPQYLTEEDIESQGLDETHLFWARGGWAGGAESLSTSSNPRPGQISSYAIIDTLMYRLANSLPNLQRVVLAGHSAGGQLAHRMAVTSPMISTLMEEFQIDVRVIVTNPSSYVYLTPERKDHARQTFTIPTTDCTPYNHYIYGLENPFPYLENTGAEEMINWYKEREVVYFLGGGDNDPDGAYLDRTCQAMLQGAHRLERGQIFFEYVQFLYGPGIKEKHHLEIVPGAGHHHRTMFTSNQGRHWLFSLE